MFDFNKITETIGGLLSGNQHQSPLEAAGIADLLAHAGISRELLDGLSQDEIFALLQQHGIDPTQLDIGQISELLQDANLRGNLSNVAQSWLSSRGS
jgi:hypothetical protein